MRAPTSSTAALLRIVGAVAFAGLLASACASGGKGGEGVDETGNSLVNCTGLYGTTPSPDGTYYMTDFGCYTDSSGQTHGDPGDNCIPACLSQAQASICKGMSGPTCEEAVNWYSADSGRYGCMTRLQVTNPNNGKSVVVLVLDAGPACTVEKDANHAVIDMSTPANLYLYGGEEGWSDKALVDVVVVPSSTPLGPVTASSSSSSSSSSSGSVSASSSSSSSGTSSTSSSSSSSSGASPEPCSVDGVAGTCIPTGTCAAMSGYVSTAGLCAGPTNIECCTPAPTATSCTVNGVDGTCISTSACAAMSGYVSTAGHCSGASDIECCTPAPVATSCTVDGVDGTCISTATCASMLGYTSTAGYCPGSSSVECCTPPPTCTVNGVSGVCVDTTACAANGGTSTPGYCAGPSDVECCTQ